MGRRDEFHIAVFPGDGIGHEVTEPCLELMSEAVRLAGNLSLVFERLPAGARTWKETGEALPKASMSAARKADAILLACMGDPSIRYPDGTEIAPQLDLRFAFGLYAGVRPVFGVDLAVAPLAVAGRDGSERAPSGRASPARGGAFLEQPGAPLPRVET